jgi:hypothetical protein
MQTNNINDNLRTVLEEFFFSRKKDKKLLEEKICHKRPYVKAL